MPFTPTVADGGTLFMVVAGAWAEIRGARGWAVGAPTKNKIDISELRDSVKREIGGKVTFGEGSFTLMVDPTEAVHIAMETAANTAGTTNRLYFKYPGSAQYILYVGSFGGFAESAQQDSIIEANITFTLSAAPVRSTVVPAVS